MTSEAPTPGSGEPVSDEARNWAMASHLSALVMFIGVPSVVGPLVAWLIKKDDPYIAYHAKEALNFNISFMIYGIVAAVLILLAIGLILLPAVFVTWLVLVVLAAVKTSSGEDYRYPLTIRFVT